MDTDKHRFKKDKIKLVFILFLSACICVNLWQNFFSYFVFFSCSFVANSSPFLLFRRLFARGFG